MYIHDDLMQQVLYGTKLY